MFGSDDDAGAHSASTGATSLEPAAPRAHSNVVSMDSANGAAWSASTATTCGVGQLGGCTQASDGTDTSRGAGTSWLALRGSGSAVPPPNATSPPVHSGDTPPELHRPALQPTRSKSFKVPRGGCQSGGSEPNRTRSGKRLRTAAVRHPSQPIAAATTRVRVPGQPGSAQEVMLPPRDVVLDLDTASLCAACAGGAGSGAAAGAGPCPSCFWRRVRIPARFAGLAEYATAMRCAVVQEVNYRTMELAAAFWKVANGSQHSHNRGGGTRAAAKPRAPRCECGDSARKLTVKKDGDNHGRAYYKCATGGCRFFRWCGGSASEPVAPSLPAGVGFSRLHKALRAKRVPHYPAVELIRQTSARGRGKGAGGLDGGGGRGAAKRRRTKGRGDGDGDAVGGATVHAGSSHKWWVAARILCLVSCRR